MDTSPNNVEEEKVSTDEDIPVEVDDEKEEKSGGASYNSYAEQMNSDAASTPTSGDEQSSASIMPSRKPGRKTDREREEHTQRREWIDTEILQLIELWRENDVLYNTTHPMYYVQAERKLTMELISDKLGISVKDVNDKMHSLRTYFCSQRQRIESAQGQTGVESISRWKFYDQMSFLYESVTNRAAKNINSSRSAARKRQLAQTEQTPATKRTSNQLPKYSPHPPRSYEPYSHTQQDFHESHTRQETIPDTHRHTPELEKHDFHRVEVEACHQTINIPTDNTSSSAKMTDKTTTKNDNCSTTTLQAEMNNGADELFGQMISNSLKQISEGHDKEKLKLDIQTLIFKTRFKST